MKKQDLDGHANLILNEGPRSVAMVTLTVDGTGKISSCFSGQQVYFSVLKDYFYSMILSGFAPTNKVKTEIVQEPSKIIGQL